MADEERHGGALLTAWSHGPFVEVVKAQGDAILMDRATGHRDLSEMAKAGQDAEATSVLCEVAEQIHSVSGPDGLIPLDVRFRDLLNSGHHPELEDGKRIAGDLLAEPEDIRPLHGDLHHENILDFEGRGWLAIDPKGVLGERGFDYANIFCNPSPEIALKDGRVEALLSLISGKARLDKTRLAKWVVAWTALSALWSMEDRSDPRIAFQISALARASLRE